MAHYTELHCHSYYSLLDGASSPAQLLQRAADLGMSALALTDHDAVYGAVNFVQAAHKVGVKPILGAELTLNGGHHITLLVENDRGWSNLCWLITQAQHHAPKGEAALPPELLFDYTDGLIALSGCNRSSIVQALEGRAWEDALHAAKFYRELFGRDHFWIELQHHLLPKAQTRIEHLVRLARKVGVGIVATNNVHYAERSGHRLQDVLVSIRHNATLDEAQSLRRPNSEYYLKSPAEMTRLFADYPEAIANTCQIAERCNFKLRYGLQDLPSFPTTSGLSAAAMLRCLCDKVLPQRYGIPSQHVLEQLERELYLIERTGLANYFLIVWDMVHFAREHGILCQGRGSAANSLVAYLLGISPIDPLAHDLVFERFLSEERQIVPDIDIDFDAGRREEVIQYTYDRYGIDHAAMACTFVTFRARSAIRDVGKALDLPPDLVDLVAKHTETRSAKNLTEHLETILGRQSAALPWELLLDLCAQIDGLPRHLGIHNGGMILTGSPLAERLPTEPATMPGRVVVQWDKEGLEDVGLVKIDILGLRMLSAIAESLDIIEQTTGTRPDFMTCTYNNPAVYAMISRGDTVGMFQVESRAQTQMLPRFKPACFADLIIAISLIRPGPIMGNMVHPYLRRRLGEEPVTYPHPLLKAALQETLGVILFQEQVLKVARDLAGFTPGQGEQLRRALGAKNATAAIDQFKHDFLEGATANCVSTEIAEAVFEALRAFGSYSFPKSHAAAFAVLVYQSAWLKCYHPYAFYTALLNNQPMGFWSPAVIVNDAKHNGIEFLPVDVNRSAGKCQVESRAIRLGFNYVKGMGETAIDHLLSVRGAGGFADLSDFCQRTTLPRRIIEHLIMAGAMDEWAEERRDLIWQLGRLPYDENPLGLVFAEDEVALPALSAAETMSLEYEMLGLSLHRHPMQLYREWCNQHQILSGRQLDRCESGQRVRVAGLNIVHQAPPTAKGHHFITLEDESGMINVIVRPNIYEQYRRIIRGSSLLIVEGIIQRRDSVINVVAGCFAVMPANV